MADSQERLVFLATEMVKILIDMARGLEQKPNETTENDIGLAIVDLQWMIHQFGLKTGKGNGTNKDDRLRTGEDGGGIPQMGGTQTRPKAEPEGTLPIR